MRTVLPALMQFGLMDLSKGYIDLKVIKRNSHTIYIIKDKISRIPGDLFYITPGIMGDRICWFNTQYPEWTIEFSQTALLVDHHY